MKAGRNQPTTTTGLALLAAPIAAVFLLLPAVVLAGVFSGVVNFLMIMAALIVCQLPAYYLLRGWLLKERGAIMNARDRASPEPRRET